MHVIRTGIFAQIALTALIYGHHCSGQERPFRESVSIPVDAEVAKSLRMIRDQWEQGPEASTLASLVQLCDTHGDQLVLQDRGVAGGVARFVKLQAVADELVAGLSPELRTEYRRQIDPHAEPWWTAWQQTGDIHWLERILRRARFSSWGQQALHAAAQWSWDQGDYTSARHFWQQVAKSEAQALSAWSPADIEARLILCDLMSQRLEHAHARFTKFEEQFPDAQGTLGGQSDRWIALLRSLAKQSSRWQAPVSSGDIATFAGEFTRQHVAPNSVDIGAEMWSVNLPNPRLPVSGRNPFFPPPLPLAFHPAVIDDLVLVNDGRQIHAWNLYSGKPYWDVSREDGDVLYPVVADPSPMMPVRPVVGQADWTVTVANGRVFARMGSAVTTPAATEFRDLPVELVCLDISQGEGQLLWKQTADDLAPAAGELPVWRWEGSPIVEGGRVYTVLSRRRPQLEWSIACLDAESGLMLWQRPLGITRPTPPDHENRASSLLLTSGGGQLYLATGWGAIVAVDPQNGLVNWAVTYESRTATDGFLGTIPLLYADGQLFAALLDGDRLACLDAVTGRFVWSRPLTEPLQQLLGVAQGRLIASGRSLWGFDASQGNLVWSVPASEPEDWGYGRGVLAGDQVLWSSKDSLWFINQADGTLLREHPLKQPDRVRTGGNLIVCQGVVLIAGEERLTAYGEYARLQDELQQPLSHHRQELRRELKLAEMAWRTGELNAAESLWESVRQLSGSSSSTEKRRAIARLDQLPHRRSANPVIRPASRTTVTPVVLNNDARLEGPDVSRRGYWRRVSQSTWPPDTKGCFPEIAGGDVPVGLLLDGPELKLWEISSDQEHRLAQATQRVVWTGQSGLHLVVITSDEVLIFDRTTKTLRHRTSLPQTISEINTIQWIMHPEGLLMLAPPREVALLDVVSGEWRWRRTKDGVGWQRLMGWNDIWLAVHPSYSGNAELWNLATGTIQRRDHPPTPPWRMAPVFLGSNETYFSVTENDRLVIHAPQSPGRWEFSGILSQTHTAPWVFQNGTDVMAVIDGTRLVQIARDSGWPRWSTLIADTPLAVPSQQIAIGHGMFFSASAGLLRAVDLTTGKKRWSTPYRITSRNGSDRCWLTSDAGIVAVLPAPSAPDPQNASPDVSEIPLFSSANGRPLQSLKLPAPTQRSEVVELSPSQTAILTDHDLLIYER